MPSRAVHPINDPIRPVPGARLTVSFEGREYTGLRGQTIAAVLLSNDVTAWRHSVTGAPRGLLCGIGVCFECVVIVDGERDVRACQRRVQGEERIEIQDDTEPLAR